MMVGVTGVNGVTGMMGVMGVKEEEGKVEGGDGTIAGQTTTTTTRKDRASQPMEAGRLRMR